MKKAKPLPPSRPWILRLAVGHWRLWSAIALVAAVYATLPANWSGFTRMIIGWDAGVLLYLLAAVVMMARSSHTDIKQHSDIQDEGASGILLLSVVAAGASFAAIFAELALAKGQPNAGWSNLLAIATVILSWTFTHIIFALHYAYEFYSERGSANGLDFPGDDKPDYWDFVYFAFVLGMTFQVSDVQITKKRIRRLATAHGVLSFLFATTIVALTVNMAASAL